MIGGPDRWDTPELLKMPGDIRHMQSIGGVLYVWTDRGLFAVKHIPPRWWHRLGWALVRAWYACLGSTSRRVLALVVVATGLLIGYVVAELDPGHQIEQAQHFIAEHVYSATGAR